MTSTLLDTEKARTKRQFASATALVATAITGLVLAGCATADPAAEPTNTSGGGDATASDINVVIMGGAPDDPFWSTVKRGAESAAKAVEAAGGTVTFVSMPNYDNFNADAAKLVGNMAAMDPSAVIVPNWSPEAQNENITSISSAGIPVVIYNSGFTTVEEVGAEIYIGSDDTIAGVAGGEAFAESGATNVVCVNTLPGTTNSEARCAGVIEGAKSGGAEASSLNLPSSQFGDPSAVTQAIKGALLNDPSIDAIITIGTTDADSAAGAIEQAGAAGKVLLGTFDVSTASLDRIKAGSQLFSIDQQPFAQGYYAVSHAFQLAAYGIYLPQSPLLTGPALITADNVDLAILGAELGVR
ncbi:simple sugar transport system substrate-binding protein [Microcella alkaliphila]|uniref:Simple sugar transport system substrate-binding protein n=1 Tax=Microcella alkaliphila TaxID=279828 RepID=A0A4Q7TZB7_9MICO|nr:substrate-binding domain-containing protein [Microcella alkaliphila]RZT66506.1 simple sugar transport system substrate-binding protein [Microcella alkaliphila]